MDMETTPYNAVTGLKYAGRNVNALGTGEWATFLQWRQKGYSVKKGEHGTKIVKFVEFISKDNAQKVAKAASAPRVYTVFERGQVELIKDPTCVLCDNGEAHEH